MKRDMDLVRDLLLYIEEMAERPLNGFQVRLKGRDDDEVVYHLLLLQEAGFLRAEVHHFAGGDTAFAADRLTWSGHEFLDAIRDPEVWRQTKAGAKTVGSASVEFLWQLAKGYAKHLAKEKLGLELG